MTQNYLVIENNTVTNVCIWDGNPSTWTPPKDATMLVQATTPAMVWDLNTDKTDWVLTEVIGQGQIGFAWNGTVCITNEPKPQNPPVANQPITSGTQDV